MNIPYAIQEVIFENKYSWKFDQIINQVILNPSYYFDVLENDHPFGMLLHLKTYSILPLDHEAHILF